MAIIYGRPDSEKKILSRSPQTIEKFEDIDTKRQKLNDDLTKERKDFFEKVPSKISVEEQKLEKIKDEEKNTRQKFDEKIKKLEEEKTEGGFSGLSASFKGYFVKNYSKKREINKIKELQKEQESRIDEWKENPEGIFNKILKETISEIKEVRIRQDGKCAICQKPPPRWEYDHIDGNRYNDILSNCQGLCPNCHSVKTNQE